MDANRGPDWVREAAAAVRDEAVRFMVTVLQCSRHPRRFATAWFAGDTHAPNPIAYVSTALAVTAAARSLTGAIVRLDDSSSLWSSLGTATLPYAYYALLGVLCHLALRLSGTTRPLGASLAIALYIGGGPGLLLTLSLLLDVLLYVAITSDAQLQHGFVDAPRWAIPILMAPVLVASGLFLVALASSFRGLHGSGRLRAVMAIVVTLVASSLLLSALDSVFPLPLGVPHFVFHLGRGALIDITF